MNKDIDIKKALKRLEDLELVLNETSIIVFTNKQGIIQYANDKFCTLSGYSQEELIGSPQSVINSNHHDREFFKEMWRTISNGDIWHGEVKNKKKDGTYYWVDTFIIPFLSEDGKPYQYVSVRHDITTLKEQEETIKKMAYYDHLTYLPNRNWLNKWLDKQTSETIKNLTVLFLDVDHFKSINDNYGHYTGDMVLKEVANRLQGCMIDTDFIIRQGGDEFIVFLNSTQNDRESVLSVIQKIKHQFTLPFYIKGEQLFITTSTGISMNASNITNINDANRLEIVEASIIQADTAMYYAKKQFGNTHCFNTNDQNDEIDRYYQIVSGLKKALNKNEFHIVYQPLVDINSNKIVGVEALLRWENPELGIVPPDEFIPLLEELGLIFTVGNWVLQTACQQMKNWQKDGVWLDRMAVNVSPIQFNEENFILHIQNIINKTNLEARFLELEITEGTIMDIDKSEKTLSALKNLGISISIDDFGTGYSSLSYLRRLPIDTLKIDKSFIDHLDKDGEVIVNTIITMGSNLNFKIIAEGIETNEQLQYLKSQNCSEGQGYFWSKPVQANEIEQLVSEQLHSM